MSFLATIHQLKPVHRDTCLGGIFFSNAFYDYMQFIPDKSVTQFRNVSTEQYFKVGQTWTGIVQADRYGEQYFLNERRNWDRIPCRDSLNSMPAHMGEYELYSCNRYMYPYRLIGNNDTDTQQYVEGFILNN